MDGWTDGRTQPFIEVRSRIKKWDLQKALEQYPRFEPCPPTPLPFHALPLLHFYLQKVLLLFFAQALKIQ